jgi:hypothetical protein
MFIFNVLLHKKCTTVEYVKATVWLLRKYVHKKLTFKLYEAKMKGYKNNFNFTDV